MKKLFTLILFLTIIFSQKTLAENIEIKNNYKDISIIEDTCKTNINGNYICLAKGKNDLLFLIKNGIILNNDGLNEIKNIIYSNDLKNVFFTGLKLDDYYKENYYINGEIIEDFPKIQNFKFLENSEYLYKGYSKKNDSFELIKNGEVIDENIENIFVNGNDFIYTKKNENGNIEVIYDGGKKTINDIFDILNLDYFGNFKNKEFEILDIEKDENNRLNFLLNNNYNIIYIKDGKIEKELLTHGKNIDIYDGIRNDYLKYLNGEKTDFKFTGKCELQNLQSCSFLINKDSILREFVKDKDGILSKIISSNDNSNYSFITTYSQENKNGKIMTLIGKENESESEIFDEIKNLVNYDNNQLIYSNLGNNLYFIGIKNGEEFLLKNNEKIEGGFQEIIKMEISENGENYLILVKEKSGNFKLIYNGKNLEINYEIKNFGFLEKGNFYIEIKDKNDGKYYLEKFDLNGNSLEKISNYNYKIKGNNLIINVENGIRKIEIENNKSENINSLKQIENNKNKIDLIVEKLKSKNLKNDKLKKLLNQINLKINDNNNEIIKETLNYLKDQINQMIFENNLNIELDNDLKNINF